MSEYQLIFLVLFWSACLWPEEAQEILFELHFHCFVFAANCRLNWVRWKLYRAHLRIGREMGWPEPEPFRFESVLDQEDL